MHIVRVRFSKTGDAAYISHLALQRVVHRALKKAHVPAWYSLGFNPHIYITFALPLPLGQESVCESFDFKCEQDDVDYAAICDGLNAALPAGLRVLSAGEKKTDAGKITLAAYTVTFSAGDPRLEEAFSAYNAGEHAWCKKLGKVDGRKVEKTYDLKETVPVLTPEKDGQGRTVLRLLLPAGSSKNTNPASLLEYLEETYGVPAVTAHILRTGIFTAPGEIFE